MPVKMLIAVFNETSPARLAIITIFNAKAQRRKDAKKIDVRCVRGTIILKSVDRSGLWWLRRAFAVIFSRPLSRTPAFEHLSWPQNCRRKLRMIDWVRVVLRFQ